MLQGTISKVVADRGFGFIKTEEKGDFFFHASALADDVGFDDLEVGQAVEFDIKTGAKGPRAVNVHRSETRVKLDETLRDDTSSTEQA